MKLFIEALSVVFVIVGIVAMFVYSSALAIISGLLLVSTGVTLWCLCLDQGEREEDDEYIEAESYINDVNVDTSNNNWVTRHDLDTLPVNKATLTALKNLTV